MQTRLKFSLATLLISVAGAIHAQPTTSEGYTLSQLGHKANFCGIHGMAFDAEGQLFAGSVVGERVYRVDPDTGDISTVVAPPEGNADDIEFLPDGTMVWTSISQNKVRAQRPDGNIIELASDLVSVNALAYRESDGRLFVSQVFGGDGLWEVDPTGMASPRNILKNIGGFNGFDVGPDGLLYGPLWFKNRVVKIDPDEGTIQTVTAGFITPAAAEFDSEGNLYVLDTADGQVYKVNIETGDKEPIVTLKTGLDNLAISEDDNLYISNMADNAIHRVNPDNKNIQAVVEPGLSCPTAISAATDNNRDTLYLADIFALRALDGVTGDITDWERAHDATANMEYPSAVVATGEHLYAVGSGTLNRYDRESRKLLGEWNHIQGILALTEKADGKLLILHNGGSTLTEAEPQELTKQQLIADNLDNALNMTRPHNGKVYVTLRGNPETGTGSVASINLDSGKVKTIADSLPQPRSIALGPDNQLYLLLDSPGKVITLDPSNGQQKTIAQGFNVGRVDENNGALPMALSVSELGNVYVIADGEGAIYKVSRQSTVDGQQ